MTSPVAAQGGGDEGERLAGWTFGDGVAQVPSAKILCVEPGWLADRDRATKAAALREAADALDERAPQWEYAGGVARDAWLRAGETLRDRADRTEQR